MAGILKQLFGGSDRPYLPSQTLPSDGWCQVRGVGRMSLVWPWHEVDDPQPLVDSHGREVGVVPQLELRAPRSDQDVVFIVWSEQGGGYVVGSDWGTSIARMYGGRIETNTPFALNGAMGRLVRVAASGQTTWRLIVPRQASVVQMETNVPSSHADAYWVQLESMLATWGWDD